MPSVIGNCLAKIKQSDENWIVVEECDASPLDSAQDAQDKLHGVAQKLNVQNKNLPT